MAGRPVEADDTFFLQFPDDVLDSPFAETGQAANIGITSAIEAFPALGGIGIFKHETVNGILAGRQPIGDAVKRAQFPRGSEGYHCGSMFYRWIIFYWSTSGSCLLLWHFDCYQ